MSWLLLHRLSRRRSACCPRGIAAGASAAGGAGAAFAAPGTAWFARPRRRALCGHGAGWKRIAATTSPGMSACTRRRGSAPAGAAAVGDRWRRCGGWRAGLLAEESGARLRRNYSAPLGPALPRRGPAAGGTRRLSAVRAATRRGDGAAGGGGGVGSGWRCCSRNSWRELQEHRDLLARRITGCADERVRTAVDALLCAPTTDGVEDGHGRVCPC